ncbi:MAG TPA: L-threonylcarbamoyladenylate synthase [candidate division Zixibacteria bacterium]|nr:L-threonylcarbamoyladenylate synthase [candidate division Zixibacteria bacterium]
MNEPTIIGVFPHELRSETLDRAVSCLLTGDLVVAPTETQYGLLARADSQPALDRVYRVKQRDRNMPLSVFVPDMASVARWGVLTPPAQILGDRFLPGPLTLVLKAQPQAEALFAQSGLAGFRVSSSPLIQALCREVGVPIVATSANLSGKEVPATVVEAGEMFGDAVALYLNGGVLARKPSTVVRCLNDEVKMIREGIIAVSEIETALGRSLQ